MRAENYVNQSASGRKIRVAILDSGVNYRPDIDVKDWVTTMAEDGVEMGCFALPDASGHGTAVASLINGSPNSEGIRGMNADAEIYSVQVLDENNVGRLSNVVQGIYWAIENHMDIINMSFGTSTNSRILYEAVKDAQDAGILMVAAAGNSGGTSAVYPAAYDEVISVGASNMQGEIADDSTYGSKVDIYAPGEDVMTNGPLFDTMVISGSSVACAEVTAAASVVWEKGFGKGSRFVRELLQQTANGRMDSSHENGMLDLEAAMDHYNSFSVEDTVAPSVEKPLPVFDEGEIRALWRQTGHQGSIPESAEKYVLLKKASTLPDKPNVVLTDKDEHSYQNPLKVIRRFHGNRNYWITLHFLIDLAHAYYQGGHTHNKAAAEDVFADASEGILGSPEGSCPYSTIRAVKIYLQDTSVFDTEFDESYSDIKAYKIMGLAIHTIGDIYAHRTMVREEDFTMSTGALSWDKFKSDNITMMHQKISNGKLEYRHLNLLLKEDAGVNYEDDPQFRPGRMANTRNTIKSLMLHTGTKDFTVYDWQGESTLKNRSSLTPYPSGERNYDITSTTYTDDGED